MLEPGPPGDYSTNRLEDEAPTDRPFPSFVSPATQCSILSVKIRIFAVGVKRVFMVTRSNSIRVKPVFRLEQYSSLRAA